MAKQKKRKRPQADNDTPQQAVKVSRLDAAAAPASAPEASGREASPQPQAPQQQQLGPQQPIAVEAAELVALHRARFVPWQPAAVVACTFTPDGSALAVGQESGGIELWETSTWTCFQVCLFLGWHRWCCPVQLSPPSCACNSMAHLADQTWRVRIPSNLPRKLAGPRRCSLLRRGYLAARRPP